MPVMLCRCPLEVLTTSYSYFFWFEFVLIFYSLEGICSCSPYENICIWDCSWEKSGHATRGRFFWTLTTFLSSVGVFVVVFAVHCSQNKSFAKVPRIPPQPHPYCVIPYLWTSCPNHVSSICILSSKLLLPNSFGKSLGIHYLSARLKVTTAKNKNQ